MAKRIDEFRRTNVSRKEQLKKVTEEEESQEDNLKRQNESKKGRWKPKGQKNIGIKTQVKANGIGKPMWDSGTKFLIKKLLIKEFLLTKVLIKKFLIDKVPNPKAPWVQSSKF
jgi:hypothetical protein